MSWLIILLPVSIGMGLVGLGAFFWAMRHGQFDDPEGNAWRVIDPKSLDEPEPEPEREREAGHHG